MDTFCYYKLTCHFYKSETKKENLGLRDWAYLLGFPDVWLFRLSDLGELNYEIKNNDIVFSDKQVEFLKKKWKEILES